MKHIRRKITVSVLGTMLFVFAVLLATVNIFIPEYLTSEAQKAILLEDERKDRSRLPKRRTMGRSIFLHPASGILKLKRTLQSPDTFQNLNINCGNTAGRKSRPLMDSIH